MPELARFFLFYTTSKPAAHFWPQLPEVGIFWSMASRLPSMQPSKTCFRVLTSGYCTIKSFKSAPIVICRDRNTASNIPSATFAQQKRQSSHLR